MDEKELLTSLEAMLSEDIGAGDVTSKLTPDLPIKAVIDSNSDGYVSGIHELTVLFKSHGVSAKAHVKDGSKISFGQRIFTLKGTSRVIFLIERTALNILSRMSGITTITRTYADTLIKSGSKTKVAATRKTAPGMMRLDKKAVLLGGGVTHRMGLYDMILFKDNHLKLFCGDVKAVLASVKKAKTRLKVEIEVSSIKDALIAAENGADMIMFDNMRPPQIREAVDLLKAKGLRKKVLLEASGGVNLDNIVLYGQAGVDWISVGRITNSSQALDYTLEVLE